MLRLSLVRVALVAISLLSAQSAAAQRWDDPRTRALVERATELRLRQLADTGLVDYKAVAQGYLTFLVQMGEGFREPPKIVRADQLALDVYWHAPGQSKQVIQGRRDTLLLPTDINYHRDHLGIIQNNFPNIIRLGDGDEVRDVPHPLSPQGMVAYEYAIRDSLEIRLPSSTLNVYEVQVRPKNPSAPAAIGAVYIDRESGDVVRMAFSFTRAALRDRQLEDVSVILQNALVEGRFWLPSRQEIEIRRGGTWMDFPVRGIIRGRWEISGYEVNTGLPITRFLGPEIVSAPAQQVRQYPWNGSLLDSLPADIRAVTDADVRKVQEEARALVQAGMLARRQFLTLTASRVSDLFHFNRVEGPAIGAGLGKNIGHGVSARVTGSYGIEDERGKVTGELRWLGGNGAGVRLRSYDTYRDVSDRMEVSMLRNSIAAQEYGSDYTDPFGVYGASLQISGPQFMALSPSVEIAQERHRGLLVHATPVYGRFEPTIPAEAMRELRVGLSVTSQIARFGFDLRSAATGAAIHAYDRAFDEKNQWFGRFSLTADGERAIGAHRLVTQTIAAGIVGPDPLPPQHLAFLGGPSTAPGYNFHEFVGRVGVSQRVEVQHPLSFYSIPLGPFAKTPPSVTIAPFASVVWVNRSASFRDSRQGFYPSIGIGVLTFFDILRIDVARGLRDGRWTFSLDARRDFWPIL
jgi:hypothetical protein